MSIFEEKLKTYVFFQNAMPRHIVRILFGSLFLALCSQIKVPLKPIPITLQTLAIFLLPYIFGSKSAFFSCMAYLIEASLGLPVLAGGKINPCWFFDPSAGYLIAFPLTAYLVGVMIENKKYPSLLWIFFAMVCGQLFIYFIGSSWLSFYVGFQKAIDYGVLPFLWISFLKIVMATAACPFIQRWSFASNLTESQ